MLAPRTNASFPIGFQALEGTPADCEDCGKAERVGFQFDYAFQPIVDLQTAQVFAHEALVRGPAGESAASVLAQVNEHNRYRFDQACRVKAIKGAAELGIRESVSINFLPNAIYKPELCIRTTLRAAQTHGFPVERIIHGRRACRGWTLVCGDSSRVQALRLQDRHRRFRGRLCGAEAAGGFPT